MLDKSKPYGTIYPIFNGARYEQNHKYFDPQGELIVPKKESEKVVEKPKRGRPAKNVEK